MKEQQIKKTIEEKKQPKPPYPATQPTSMTAAEFAAVRKVTSGQLFGPRDLPQPRS
jgi:hypothetical protein